jgi:hypothetical protein
MLKVEHSMSLKKRHDTLSVIMMIAEFRVRFAQFPSTRRECGHHFSRCSNRHRSFVNRHLRNTDVRKTGRRGVLIRREFSLRRLGG